MKKIVFLFSALLVAGSAAFGATVNQSGGAITSANILLNLPNVVVTNNYTPTVTLVGQLTASSITANGTITANTLAANTSIISPAYITNSGAMTFTPASGSGASFVLATTGDFAVNTNQLFVDTSAASVGIGTTTPQTKVDVVTAAANRVQLGNSAGGVADDYVLTIGMASNVPFLDAQRISQGPINLILQSGGGNLGIGTTTLGGLSKLTVSAGVTVDGTVSANYFVAQTGIRAANLDSSAGTAIVQGADGNLHLLTSSKEGKDKIKALTFSSDLIDSIVVKQWRYKGQKDILAGPIAEELAQVAPLFVNFKDGKPFSIRNDQVMWLLLVKVQELEKRLSELEAK